MRIIALILFVLGSPLYAATYYVTQAGAGSADGSSLGNAASVATLNAHTLSPDDVVSLNGTITTAITAHDSGTSGHPITYLFASGAKFSKAAWATTGAIVVSGKNYITIDGGTNGLIENTDNGTNLGNQVDSRGILATEASNLTVQNLAISNLYVRVKGTDQASGGIAIVNKYNGGSAFSNFTVNNCVIHDVGIGVSMDYGPGCSGYTLSNCTIYNVNWGGNAGDHSNASTLDNLTVSGNTFYNWDNWTDTAVSNTFHHNGFYGWSEQLGGTSRITTVRCYGNIVGPGYNSTASTSGVFFSGNVGDVLVYNNVFIESGASDYPADGLVAIWVHDGNQTGFQVDNNTIIGGGGGIGLWFYAGNGATAYLAKNNLITNVATAISQFFNGSATLSTDYNLFYGITAGTAFNTSANSSSSFKTYAQWQGLGNETHGVNGSDPLLSGTYRLGAGSPAIGTGTDLSAYFTTDAAGYTRSIPWDIGAYKYLYPATAASGTIQISGRTTIL